MPDAMIVERTSSDARTADVLSTQARLDAIILSAEAYCRQSGGVYPANFEQMMAPPPSISRCRLHATDIVDGWGRPIFYAVVGGRTVIASAGSDGRFSTADDIARPEASDMHAEAFQIPAECGGQ